MPFLPPPPAPTTDEEALRLRHAYRAWATAVRASVPITGATEGAFNVLGRVVEAEPKYDAAWWTLAEFLNVQDELDYAASAFTNRGERLARGDDLTEKVARYATAVATYEALAPAAIEAVKTTEEAIKALLRAEFEESHPSGCLRDARAEG